MTDRTPERPPRVHPPPHGAPVISVFGHDLGIRLELLKVRDILEEVEIEIIKNSLMKVWRGSCTMGL